MRLPYVSDPPPTSTPEEAEILARVKARHGWNSFIGAIRTKTTLSTIIKELIICRVAVLNGAWFEWEQHAPLLEEGGLSDEGMHAVRDIHADIPLKIDEKALSPAEGAVLKYTDAMTKTVTVPEEVFQELKGFFNEREIVEITTTVAAYNCVSRFLVALNVGEKNP
ncbi:carboxymuconolactone decarboxylase family protein [Aspergillus novofumigatus IBT 16806]|uniref:Rhodanese domain-containing protein n=1 Tax=Aspergillus novofumigatus (strain IBT 16806) TaxID=1392255 RepID=A0A2I1BW27_ASPN1|nr:uncharacterized protein P174DRAFT_424767 [Aspergillus novofumigatus IBT 16806]PKX89585.1 hypothetical protein P174DRAFT_424767 [Aspergillus novofumigatus IBT 16806]